jgi:hypothetical protein
MGRSFALARASIVVRGVEFAGSKAFLACRCLSQMHTGAFRIAEDHPFFLQHLGQRIAGSVEISWRAFTGRFDRRDLALPDMCPPRDLVLIETKQYPGGVKLVSRDLHRSSIASASGMQRRTLGAVPAIVRTWHLRTRIEPFRNSVPARRKCTSPRRLEYSNLSIGRTMLGPRGSPDGTKP